MEDDRRGVAEHKYATQNDQIRCSKEIQIPTQVLYEVRCCFFIDLCILLEDRLTRGPLDKPLGNGLPGNVSSFLTLFNSDALSKVITRRMCILIWL